MKLPLKHLPYIFSLAATISISLTISSVYASWAEPQAAPPQGNIAAPLNVSSQSQSKAGGLYLGTGGPQVGLMVGTSSVIFGGPLSIGTLDTTAYRNFPALFPGTKAGGVDIVWAGTINYPSTLILGADTGGVYTRTNNTNKQFWVSMPSYNLGNYYSAVIGGYNSNGLNEIYIGGGSSNFTAANTIKFYTSNNQVTPTIVETASISTSGIKIGTGAIQSPAPNAQVGNLDVNDVYLRATNKWLSQPTAAGFSNYAVYDFNGAKRSDGGGIGTTSTVNGNIVYTWTVPSSVRKIMVEAWGGGGKGAGDTYNTSAGGGAGGYGKGIFSVNPGTPYGVIIGRGNGVTTGSGDSTFESLITSSKGRAGAVGIGTAGGGAGGTSTAPINISGQDGGQWAMANTGFDRSFLFAGGSSPNGGGGGQGNGSCNGEIPGGGGAGDSRNGVLCGGAPGRIIVWW